MFPMRVYLYLFAPFVFLSFYTFTRQKNILYTHQSFSIVIYISHTTVGKSTSQLFSITSYLFFLIAVFTLYKRKKKKDTRRYVFFFRIFFPLCGFSEKKKKNHPDHFNGQLLSSHYASSRILAIYTFLYVPKVL